MGSKIIFSKIENGTIFVDDYVHFSKNNTISFSSQGIAVLYGPNGTGKTSLVKVFSGEKGTSIKYEYNGIQYSDESQFYVINDQNNRNIIAGTAKDFLLGDNIKREFELQEYLDAEYKRLCEESIATLKSNYGISSGTSKAIDCFNNLPGFMALVKDLVNSRSKGTKYGLGAYIVEMESLLSTSLDKYEDDKMSYLITDLSEKTLLINDVESLDVKKIANNEHIREVEENAEAIKVLTRFKYKQQCIVCDTENIDSELLLEKKEKNREKILKGLDVQSRRVIEKILLRVDIEDPFGIKKTLLKAIESGDLSGIELLQNELKEYKEKLVNKVIVDLITLYKKSDIKQNYDEYQKMISQKPEISEEDILYIEQVINNSMNKSLKVVRDDKKNLKIMLEDKEFLGVERDKLPLSTGEQNFLSLTFEFLKAKNSDKPIVVLDDPISSFDSIYKNKIAYAIIRILKDKERIILTHNVDLLRLLDGQYKKCFKLFLFNNTENEENGFIALNHKERDMLINLEELLKTFREEIYPNIKDVKLFLVSMIPFLRGYAALINDTQAKEDLTQVMHGYKLETINVAQIYRKLFGNEKDELVADTNNIIPIEVNVCVKDILNMTTDGKEIINKEKYPLLNRTLMHSFSYLFLRLLVEKELVDKYSIDTTMHTQLGQIIDQAFPDNKNRESVKCRVMLTSKKTLLNEFNHFEGNMSIFQPAIDITDHMLGKEKTDILSFVNNL